MKIINPILYQQLINISSQEIFQEDVSYENSEQTQNKEYSIEQQK